MRLVLPEDEVVEGDEWEFDPRAYLVVMWPGGLVGFLGEDEDEVDPFERDLDRQIIESLEGEAWATFEGVEERDGIEVAVITVEIRIECEAEATKEDEDGDELTREVSVRRDVEGLVFWDLSASRLAGAELEADSEMVFSTTRELEDPEGNWVDVTQEQSFSGTIEYEVSVTPVD